MNSVFPLNSISRVVELSVTHRNNELIGDIASVRGKLLRNVRSHHSCLAMGIGANANSECCSENY